MTVASRKRSIALLTPAFYLGGGVPAVVEFLYRVLLKSGEYLPEVISLATSARDPSNLSLSSLSSWFRGIGVERGTWQTIPYTHFGAVLGEFEFQRYRPRHLLCKCLQRFDLVQVVAGSPAWAAAAGRYRGPVALQVASLTAIERESALTTGSAMFRVWRSLMTRVTTRVETFALRKASAVFVENQWMYERLCRERDLGRVIFAPPGIDTDFFRPATYKPDGYILCVARLSDRRKNVRMLFQAYHDLRARMPNAPKLVLAGNSSPSGEDLRLARELQIDEFIEMHVDVSKGDLKALYQEAALFVLSSDEEGLGIVILEAMASGLPVVSTRCGGPETSVLEGKTGYLVPVRDAGALAETMYRLIENLPLRKQMSIAAREHALARFSFEAAAKPFLQEYATLLGQTGT